MSDLTIYTEMMKAVINYGVLGVIFVCIFSPLVALIWSAVRGIRKHAEGTVVKFKAACDAVTETQPQMLSSLDSTAGAVRENTEIASKTVEMILEGRKTTQGMLATLQPTDEHPFSTLRAERLLWLGVEALRIYIDKEEDNELRDKLTELADKMQAEVSKKLHTR